VARARFTRGPRGGRGVLFDVVPRRSGPGVGTSTGSVRRGVVQGRVRPGGIRLARIQRGRAFRMISGAMLDIHTPRKATTKEALREGAGGTFAGRSRKRAVRHRPRRTSRALLRVNEKSAHSRLPPAASLLQRTTRELYGTADDRGSRKRGVGGASAGAKVARLHVKGSVTLRRTARSSGRGVRLRSSGNAAGNSPINVSRGMFQGYLASARGWRGTWRQAKGGGAEAGQPMPRTEFPGKSQPRNPHGARTAILGHERGGPRHATLTRGPKGSAADGQVGGRHNLIGAMYQREPARLLQDRGRPPQLELDLADSPCGAALGAGHPGRGPWPVAAPRRGLELGATSSGRFPTPGGDARGPAAQVILNLGGERHQIHRHGRGR